MERGQRTLSGFVCLFFVCLAARSFAVSEPPPDSLQYYSPSAGNYHLFDGFDIGTYYPSFDGVFELYVTDGVEARWGNSGVAQFIESVMDDDSTNTDDVFPLVWNYFCTGDSDTTYARVRFKVCDIPPTYTKIDLYLYDKTDFDCSVSNKPKECYEYSWMPFCEPRLILAATDRGAYKSVDEVVKDAFAHELQHLCFHANWSGQWPTFYGDVNESLSTCSEYMWQAWQVRPANSYDQSYDASILRCERCDPYSKYPVEQVWMGYLYDAFVGNPADMSDDLIYRWLRYKDQSGHTEITLATLSVFLESGEYAWLGGETGGERLQHLFQNFLIAKFCNAPDFGEDSRFGFDDFSPVSDLGFFLVT